MMKHQLYIIYLLILVFFSPFYLEAVPAYPYPMTITQPDGSTITVQLLGDEHRKITTTIDGYVIKKNKQGIYTYAVQDNSRSFIASDMPARDPKKRDAAERAYLTQIKKSDETPAIYNRPSKIRHSPTTVFSSGFPRTGSPKSLVILVNFSDVSFVIPNPKDAFTRLLNEENYSDNGGTGSARDYFQTASNGQFNPQFDVVGPYTLPNPMAYYGANDTVNEQDVKPAYMIVDACNAADSAGIDFAQYDLDNDGYIDNVFVYYAGYNEAEHGPDDSVWPHRWAVQPGYNFEPNNQSLITFDNKKVFDYACTSELKGRNGTSMCGIGTFAHEFGHVIGLPDYYHTAPVNPETKALEYWSIMDSGAYLNGGRTPPTYSAYDRFFLGWLTPEEINIATDVSLYPLSQSKVPLTFISKQAYLLAETSHNLVGTNPLPKEFYLLEYRKKTGWDSYIPKEGLLIWHIDYDQLAWYNNEPNNYSGATQTSSDHMRVYLQPLNGSETTPGDAFTSGGFNPMNWAGNSINRPITGITKTADSISFKIMGGTPIIDPGVESNIQVGVVKSSLQFPTTQTGTENIKQLKIKTTLIVGDLSIVISGNDAAMFNASTQNIPMSEANSILGTDITITYSPQTVGTHTAILTIAGGGLNPEKVIELKGKAN